MENLKIKLLRKLMYVWDVVFTYIDNKQLRVYLAMKSAATRLAIRQHNKKIYRMDEYCSSLKSWKSAMHHPSKHLKIKVGSGDK